jgi:hypothetical protein
MPGRDTMYRSLFIAVASFATTVLVIASQGGVHFA